MIQRACPNPEAVKRSGNRRRLVALAMAAISASILTSACASDAQKIETVTTQTSRGIQLFEASIGSTEGLHMFIDTGVDPSVIDEEQARRLALPVDDTNVGEAAGSGDGEGLAVRFSEISGLKIGDTEFAAFDALAADLSGFGSALGVDLAVILGFSFLNDQVVRIDYRTNELSVSQSLDTLPPLSVEASERTEVPFQFNSEEDPIPVFEMEYGGHTFWASLDTGKSGGVEFFQSLEDRFSLSQTFAGAEQTTARGARGERDLLAGEVNGLSIGSLQLGPTDATFGGRASEGGMREANVGNAAFSGMVVTIDYPAKRLFFER